MCKKFGSDRAKVEKRYGHTDRQTFIFIWYVFLRKGYWGLTPQSAIQMNRHEKQIDGKMFDSLCMPLAVFFDRRYQTTIQPENFSFGIHLGFILMRIRPQLNLPQPSQWWGLFQRTMAALLLKKTQMVVQKFVFFLPVASVPREIIDVNLGIYREVKDHLPFVPLLQLILKHFKLFQNITPDFTLKRQESGA